MPQPATTFAEPGVISLWHLLEVISIVGGPSAAIELAESAGLCPFGFGALAAVVTDHAIRLAGLSG